MLALFACAISHGVFHHGDAMHDCGLCALLLAPCLLVAAVLFPLSLLRRAAPHCRKGIPHLRGWRRGAPPRGPPFIGCSPETKSHGIDARNDNE
jgi:hypothetical protein